MWWIIWLNLSPMIDGNKIIPIKPQIYILNKNGKFHRRSLLCACLVCVCVLSWDSQSRSSYLVSWSISLYWLRFEPTTWVYLMEENTKKIQFFYSFFFRSSFTDDETNNTTPLPDSSFPSIVCSGLSGIVMATQSK